MRRAATRYLRTAGAVALGLAIVAGNPGPVRAENLADALVGAYNTSGLLEQNRALLRAADEDVALAVSSLRPILDFTARVIRDVNEGRTDLGRFNTGLTRAFAGLRAEWLIYDGGARNLGVQAAQETVLATRQALISVEQLILFRAAAAYVNVLLQAENVTLRENNVRVLEEELRAAQDRFEVGEVTKTDVALAESRLAAAQSSLAAARGALDNARAEYVNAVGRLPGTLEKKPPMPAVAKSIPEAEAVAVRNHPDILAAQHQVTAAELTVDRFTRAYGPNASIGAEVGMQEDWGSSDFGRNAGVSLSMRQPIYQGGALAVNVRRAKATRDAVRANLLTVQRDVVQNVNDAFIRLEVAKASLVATEERVRAARVAFEGIREEATLGARTTLDVLTAEQELLNALTTQISDIAEQYIATYQLLASQGLLTAEKLGLAVQIYDPTMYYKLVKDAPAALSRRGRDLDRVIEALGKQ